MNALTDLTARQREVLDLMCQGLPTKLISQKLHLSTHTVAEYRHIILKQMGVANAVELANLVNQDRQAKEDSLRHVDYLAALNKNPELIVVEDDEHYRDIVMSSLSQMDFICRGVDSFRKLQTAMQEKLADIILLDLNLGSEDGLDIARRLSEDRKVGIIMMTTRGMIEQRIDGLAVGADAYLVKPVDMRELIGVIRNLHRRLVDARFRTPDN